MVNISKCTAANLKDAATSLRSGNLVAFPTETVYGLGADATNKTAIENLYKVKGRPKDHPLIVHISSMENLDRWASEVPEYAIRLARTFWPGSMTLILPRTNLAKNFITGSQENVALRVPSHSLALSLLAEFEAQGGVGVAAPSANRFGRVSPTTAEAVYEELSDYLSPVDLILDGGPCQVGVESTIINCTKAVPEILRPGAITTKLIYDQTGIEIHHDENDLKHSEVKVSGLLKSHYAPKAKVFLSIEAQPGDGFIALSNISTPTGAVRLASPTTNFEYAQILYRALRSADNQRLVNVYVVPPSGNDIAIAVRDRLQRCASSISKNL
jgi:L-threonylcarbamoyladenylate synthase